MCTVLIYVYICSSLSPTHTHTHTHTQNNVHKECPQCTYGALCSDVTDIPQCDCSHIQCTDAGVEVCGSDDETYNSRCELELEACQSQRPVFWLHDGSCDLQSESVNRPFTSDSIYSMRLYEYFSAFLRWRGKY